MDECRPARPNKAATWAVYDRGNVLISAQISSPSGWSFGTTRCARGFARHGVRPFAAGVCQPDSYRRMLAEHTPLDGEVPISHEKLPATLQSIRDQGYLERDRRADFRRDGCLVPHPGTDNTALATLTCPTSGGHPGQRGDQYSPKCASPWRKLQKPCLQAEAPVHGKGLKLKVPVPSYRRHGHEHATEHQNSA